MASRPGTINLGLIQLKLITVCRTLHGRNIERSHDDVIKWKHFPRYWPFVRGIHRSPVNSPHKGQWRGALMFSLICDWINGWVNNREAGDLRRHRAHYDVIVMLIGYFEWCLIRESFDISKDTMKGTCLILWIIMHYFINGHLLIHMLNWLKICE